MPIFGLGFLSGNWCIAVEKLSQDMLIFNDVIRVVASILTFRQSNPLGGVFFIVPEPLEFRQLFKKFSQLKIRFYR